MLIGIRMDLHPGMKSQEAKPRGRPAELQLNPYGAASCRFATRPVLRTRPGHPKSSVPPLNFNGCTRFAITGLFG